MNQLLQIISSPRGAESKSTLLADTYLAALRAANPDLSVDVLDVWAEDLPAFDGNKTAAKMNLVTGQAQDAAQRSAWDQIVSIAQRFIAADRYVISVPMWNGGIPYRLKQYIDIIHQPGLTFGLSPDSGYSGLLEHKHATLVLTAGAYAEALPSPQFGIDHQSTYLRAWLNQAGVTAIDEIRFQPTLLTANPESDLESAKERAVLLANAHGRL
jgi:FMN-dependent NADH-azoreductase